MQKREDFYGIDMIDYCRKHEAYIKEHLDAGDDPKALLEWHEHKLAWVQHERLVHLIVMCLTAVAFLFALFLEIYMQWNLGVLPFLLVFLVLLGAYVVHYFRLENTVQHWYHIAEQLHDRVMENETQLKEEHPSQK